MPLAGFEVAVPADDRPQTFALDCVGTGTGDEIFGSPKLNNLL